ncbi:MAG: penicillin-binding protein 2 [Candidatus Binatia bacterium]
MPVRNTSEEYDVALATARTAPPGFHRRLGIALALSLVAFTVLVFRLWHLQVVDGDYHRSLSEHNRVRVKRVNASRGIIFDRNGKVLVENRPSFDVIMVPEDARQPSTVLGRLGRYLGQDLVDAEKALVSARGRPAFESVVLRRDVDWDTLVVVETRQIELPGISLHVGPRRSYLYGSLAAHLLGYVGEVNPDELQRLEGYRMGDMIGKYGLERRWEEHLRGESGGRQVEVDAVGRELRVLREVEEVPGANIHLTIDVELQRAAMAAMEGKEGAVVALDPNTGAVLAMVSRPSYDPNLFAAGISTSDWRQLVTDPLHPLSNKAIQGQYPPGSTFKIVVAAAALEEGIVTPFTPIHCVGSLRYGNRDFRCWKRGGHGWVNLHRAIVESCDVFFYQVGQRLGVDTIAEYSRRFGLGEPTGIVLDYERSGTIPDTVWKRQRFGDPWYPGETLSVAIGQGYVTATPLQMANVVATVAAGGVRHQPYFVDHVARPGEEPLYFGNQEPVRTGIRASTITQIQNALRDVVQSESGTGKRARVPGVEVGGKTGTSQTARMARDYKKVEPGKLPRHLRDHAWFVALAPVEAPEIAVAALVEHAGGGGGAIAAPVVQQVLDFYFNGAEPAGPENVQQTASTPH